MIPVKWRVLPGPRSAPASRPPACSACLACLALPAIAIALALGSAACVEQGTYDRAASQLDDARRAGAQKDQQIRTLQWQLAVLDQQFRAAEQRNESVQQTLSAELQKLGAANLELGDRLSKEQRDRATLLAASAPLPSLPGKDARAGRDGAEDLRRVIAALDTRNAQILEELARIERLLGGRQGARGEAPSRGERSTAGDVIDPWGFGSRK